MNPKIPIQRIKKLSMRTKAKSPVHGVFLCNKPSGLSSNRVLQIIKRSFGVKKAGHTGSLDPLATGVLPLCFGEATKFAQFGLESVKCYRVVAKLGISTETGDSDGEVCLEMARPGNFVDTSIQDIIPQFIGVQKQTPSQFSALKYQGKPLYEYARQGIVVPIPTRDICISEIKIEDINLAENTFTLWVCCSKGTYIRSLVQDIGRALGWCAHVIALHRTHAGLFEDESCEKVSFDEEPLKVSGSCLPVSTLLLSLPWWFISGPEALKLDNGHAVLMSAAEEIQEMRTKCIRFAAMKGVNLKGIGVDPVMQDFYRTLELQSSKESDGVQAEFMALYTTRPGIELSADEVRKLSESELQEKLMLRGLVEKKSEFLQPRRMVSPNIELF